MRLAASLVIGLIALAATAAATASPQYVPSIVTLDGVGDVRPGQSVAQVGRSFGVALRPDRIRAGCAQAPFSSGAVRGHATFVRGRLGLALVRPRRDRRARNRRRRTFTALRRAYRRLEIRQDPGVSGARNAFVRRTAAPHWLLRFDVSAKGRVTGIAFGDRSVYAADGCA